MSEEIYVSPPGALQVWVVMYADLGDGGFFCSAWSTEEKAQVEAARRNAKEGHSNPPRNAGYYVEEHWVDPQTV
jgi:hypothetical protein